MGTQADKFKSTFASLNGYFLERAPLSTMSEKQLFNNILSSLKDYYEYRQRKAPAVNESNRRDKMEFLLTELLGVNRTEEYMKYPIAYLSWCMDKNIILQPRRVKLEWLKLQTDIESQLSDLRLYETILELKRTSKDETVIVQINSNIKTMFELYEDIPYMINLFKRIDKEKNVLDNASIRFTEKYKTELLKYLYNKKINGIY
jgi:hypothetical protein